MISRRFPQTRPQALWITVSAGDRPSATHHETRLPFVPAKTAPGEASNYELRYVFGREIDRHVAYRTRLVVGGPGGVSATPDAAEPDDRADAGSPDGGLPKLVDATFQAETGGLALVISWSAAPLPGQDLPPEAWAINPIRWIESNGVCTESAAGPLCISGQPDSEVGQVTDHMARPAKHVPQDRNPCNRGYYFGRSNCKPGCPRDENSQEQGQCPSRDGVLSPIMQAAHSGSPSPCVRSACLDQHSVYSPVAARPPQSAQS